MKRVALPVVVDLVLAGILYYMFLPAINLHSTAFWFFVFVLLAALACMSLLTSLRTDNSRTIYFAPNTPVHAVSVGPSAKVAKVAGIAAAVVVVFVILMNIYSSPIFHAKAYAAAGAGRITEGDFNTDVSVVKDGYITDIAIMDTLTASTLGSRQIGSLGTLATQYELGQFMTTTINGQITKIAPLGYGSFFKWLNSRKNGMPGYVTVDPVIGASEYVELASPMYYTDSGWFGDNVYRKIRFAYPTAIFYNVHFEIDNSGNPYWVAIVDSFQVGLFGCEVPNGVITCDAVTGECEKYTVDDIPEWVSIAYSGDDLSRLVDYAGTYANGYLNSIMAKTDVYRCTDDYGYKVVGDNLNCFTGVTSAASDQSNIAFVLCDEHTGQIIRYNIYGAEEYSAETAAEGVVLNYGYDASFPSICNVEGQPVYVMALTDSGNLIKKYAMVDLQDYTKVVVGDSVKETWQNFITKYCGITPGTPGSDSADDSFASYDVTVNGLLREPVLGVSGGSSYVYLYGSDGNIYRVLFDGSEGLLMGTAADQYALTVTGLLYNNVYTAGDVRVSVVLPATVAADSTAEAAA